MSYSIFLKVVSKLSVVAAAVLIATATVSASEKIDTSTPLPSSQYKAGESTANTYKSSATKDSEVNAPSNVAPAPASKDTAAGKTSYTSTMGHNYNVYSYYGSQLGSVQQKQAYDAMVNDILTTRGATTTSPIYFNPPLEIRSTVDVNSSTSLRMGTLVEIQKAIDAFRFDFPQVYWIKPSSTVSDVKIRRGGDGTVYVTSAVIVLEQGGVSDTDIVTINSTVENIIAQANTKGTHYEKIKTVHDMLAETIQYTSGNNYNYRDFEVVGALSDREGVCQAYAESFKVIADRMGYKNVLGAGTGITNSGESQPHMWNYIQIDGKWYAVDVTWDDQNPTIYDCLLVGKDTQGEYLSGTFGSTHLADGQFSNVDYSNFSFPDISSSRYN